MHYRTNTHNSYKGSNYKLLKQSKVTPDGASTEIVPKNEKKRDNLCDYLSFWWEQRESNPRPSACKADALNQLSYAPETGLQIYD